MDGILFPEAIAQANIGRIGGKARGLWLLARRGFEVPPFFVAGTEVFREAAESDVELWALLGRLRRTDGLPGGELLAALNARVLALPLPPAFDAALAVALERLLRDAPGAAVSVRSSAAVEDRPGQSFAGQFRSILFVRGFEAVRRAVRQCWASAFAPGVAAYARASRGAGAVPEMAVVVQRMVAGEVSGVAFSVDPVGEAQDRILVTAGYGTCDGIVADRVGTDQYAVPRGGGAAERTLGSKRERMAPADGADEGTAAVAVDEAAAERSALDDAQIARLARLVEEIQALWGVPVDVEWTLADGRYHVLQARPITTLPCKDPVARPRLLWDNSNIVESYSGVTSPLTFTFASSGYAVIYRQFGRLVGDSEAFLAAHEKELANMLGLHKGRVFYNLLNWYLALYYFPGFRFNKAAMESMMGVKESLDFQVPTGPPGFFEKWFVEVPKVVYMIGRVAWNSFRVDARVRDFHENFEKVYGPHAALDLDRMQVPAILEMGEKVRKALMYRWTAPILTDCLAMMTMQLLKVVCRDWIGGDRAGLQNDLLAGEGGIDSTKPTKTLVAMAARIRADAAQRELFTSISDSATLRARVETEPGLAPVKAEVERFQKEFGFRCIGELKLEQDSIKEDPSFVYSMLANYVHQPDVDLGRMEAREKRIRADAEAHAEANVKDGFPGKGLRRRVFRWLVASTRKHVKNRENMRFARTRIFGFFREVFDAVGLKLFAAGLLEHPKDVYYLTIDELYAFAEGRSVTQDIRSLARLRFEEYQRFRAETVPDRFTTHGVVYAPGNQRPDPLARVTGPAAAAAFDGRRLSGVSCCPGLVRGKVRVIQDAASDLRLAGEILAAPRTDPGWVPLFPSSSGLLIESGSVLSHSAIVARELGIPAIVGIKGLMQHISDGQIVEMDGGRGVVDLAPEAPAGAAPG